MADEFTWNGAAVEAVVEAAAVAGLTDAARELLATSQRIVPRESGDLAKTGKVTVSNGELKAVVSYGGAYAVQQHEALHQNHHGSGQAKYLEVPVSNGSASMQAAVAHALREALS